MKEKKPKPKTTAKKAQPKKTQKSGKQNSSTKSKEQAKLHEPIIQDRIAGLASLELAKKHKISRQQVTTILNKHEARITKERDELLRLRQEAINSAFFDDIDNMSKVITQSNALMMSSLKELEKDLKKIKDFRERVLAIRLIRQIYRDIRMIYLTQQRDGEK